MNKNLKRAIFSAMFFLGAATLAHADCRQAYFGDFVHRKGHKAMATTGGRSYAANNISCGNAWDAPTVAAAKREALKACRVSDRKYHDKGVCTVILAK
jgi:hypothetical protein